MNDSAPTVSVIVPNYRHGRYLRQRLESILSQSEKDFELIILDDASTDDSCAVIAQYLHHPRVRFIANEINSGDPFSQWNKGADVATGKYLWIAESDDFAESDFLEALLDSARRNPTAGIIYCQSDLVDSDSRLTGTLAAHYDGLDAPGRWNSDHFALGPQEVVQFLLLRNTIPNASACLFRTDVYRKIGGATKGYKLCGDWMTYVRMLQCSDIAFCSRTLNHYRVHAETARNSSERAVLESVETYEVLDFIASHFRVDSQRKAKAATLAFDRMHFLLERSGLNNIDGWDRLARAACHFDLTFGERLRAPSAWRCKIAAVYSDANGNFSEQCSQQLTYPAGARCTLRFGPCSGQLRLDPASSEGLVTLFAVRLTAASGETIWQADDATSFAGLQVAGTAIRIPSCLGMTLFAWGNDPIVLFPGAEQSACTGPYFVEVDLEAGSRSLHQVEFDTS